MINLNQILCPVDLSKNSLLALKFANALAGRYRSFLTVIHVLQNPHVDVPGSRTGSFSFGEVIDLYKEERQEEILSVLRKKGSHATGYEIIFKEGVPCDEIANTAKKIKADMIIMSSCASGSHGIFLGCTTERTIRLAPCPVLSIQTNHDQKSQEEIEQLHDLMDTSPNTERKILLPTDFSEHSILASKYAISLAKEYDAELIVLHVIENVAELSFTSNVDLPGYNSASIYYDELLRVAQEKVGDISQEALEQGISVSDRIIYGNPKNEILDIAKTEQINLIVMGTHGRKGFSRLINGSVAEAVVRRAHCSVLSVKYPEHDFIDVNKQ